jgi:hypothetical protein
MVELHLKPDFRRFLPVKVRNLSKRGVVRSYEVSSSENLIKGRIFGSMILDLPRKMEDT